VALLRASVSCLVVGASLLVTAHADAATGSAASCSNTDVQSAINSAAAGDTVLVPAGNCTWTGAVAISGKALTLRGAGIGVTTITDGVAPGAMLTAAASSTNFVDISGFTFVKGADKSGGTIAFDPVGGNSAGATVGFRFHGNRVLIASASSTHFLVPATVYGLIDHNTFDITATSGSIGVFDPFGSPVSNDGGYTPWQRPLTLGTDKAVYFEDNAVNGTTQDAGTEDCIDAYSGARFVIRYNTFLNCTVGFHGLDTGGMRAPVSFEIYNNTFTNNSSVTLRAATVRGGTGVVFNNTYGGSHGSWGGITLMLYRVVQPQQAGNWQVCDGTNWEIGSTSLSSSASRIASTTGGVGFSSTNRDLIGAFGTGTFTTYLDGSGPGGYPCRDQPGIGPGQVSQPIYVWNNTGISGMGSYDGGTGISDANYLKSGRDYFDNTPRPNYTAYTYPHPLTGAGSPPPAAPTNLRVVQ
jgi:hypothetical protein